VLARWDLLLDLLFHTRLQHEQLLEVTPIHEDEQTLLESILVDIETVENLSLCPLEDRFYLFVVI
jgi:hypothetical protein